MKRILFVDLSPSPGGSIISLYHLTSRLDRSRFEPLVVLSAVNDFTRFEEGDMATAPVVRVRTPQWEERPAGLVDRVRAGRIGQEMRGSPQRARVWHSLGEVRRYQRNILPVVRSLRKVIRRFDPQLLHLNDAIPLMRHGILAGRLTGVPAICHCRSFLAPTSGDNRLLVPGLDGLIFISEAVAKSQLAAIARPPLYQVIPNALNVADYLVPVDPERVRSSLDVPGQVPLVGMIGRISPWKGQHVFVEALALLSRRFPAVHGVIVGFAEEADGPGYADRVRRQARDLGLAGRLCMTGFREDVPQLLAVMDAVVHCSVEPEPFGRVIIEGMAAGRPVVGSRAGGAVEIITDGVDGLLVPPGDPAALADALADLLSNPTKAARLGTTARQTALQRFDLGAHLTAVEAFYDRVLATS